MVLKPKGSKHHNYVARGKEYIKYYDHRKNRRATSRVLQQGEFDQIPQRHKVRGENPWNWD